jgi:iron-sulfur cluster repair protein YtfE (RIC family)
VSASQTIQEFFSHDHRVCDDIWGEIEAMGDGDPARALARWKAFEAAMLRHFAMEEEVLFPAFEDATGMHGGGPTAVMRMEHVQMKKVLEQMAQAAARSDVQGLLDQGDTLLMLIQQHNVKEEGMLYPMADRALAARLADLMSRLAAYAD